MPIITSFYKPPIIFRNGFFATVFSGLALFVNGVKQTRERLILSDDDFLDLDWSFAAQKTDRLIIVLHGLEGDAQRPYMLGTAKVFNNNAIDAVCVNFRGCSGEDNVKFSSYHSGKTDDLEEVIQHIIDTKHYSEIYLKGFSLGGNVVIKYLGERSLIPYQIKAAIAVSVPCFLSGSAIELHKFKNVLYHDRFKRHLLKRLKLKQKRFPELISKQSIASINTLKDFDDIYTSKAHGFIDAQDYYKKSSCLQFLHNIKTPTLILNAKNDSFLSKECYPTEPAQSNPNLSLEMPKYGGHVGFYVSGNIYYNESRALEFVLENNY